MISDQNQMCFHPSLQHSSLSHDKWEPVVSTVLKAWKKISILNDSQYGKAISNNTHIRVRGHFHCKQASAEYFFEIRGVTKSHSLTTNTILLQRHLVFIDFWCYACHMQTQFRDWFYGLQRQPWEVLEVAVLSVLLPLNFPRLVA